MSRATRIVSRPSLGFGGLLIVVGLLLPLPRAFSVEPYEQEYQQARTRYYQLKGDPARQKFRHHWLKVAGLFERVAERYPDSARADDALFTAGRLYYDLYLISRLKEDLDRSVSLFERLVEKYPDSHLADDGQMAIALQWIEHRKDAEKARSALSRLIERFPKGDVTPKARRMLEDLGGAPVGATETREQSETVASPAKSEEKPVLSEIEHRAGKDYARVTLFTRTRTSYKVGRLDPAGKHDWPRLYVDILLTSVDPDLKSPLKIEDGLIRQIRFAPHDKDTIRVVIDLAEAAEHKVFPMDNPARVVIDFSSKPDRLARVIGEKSRPEPRPEPAPEKRPPVASKPRKAKPRLPSKSRSRPGKSLSMLAGLKVRRVVVDPGHGGSDPGAIGQQGTLEKEVVLDIAKRLTGLLKGDKQLGLKEVTLTRADDRFLGLEQRTAIANEKKADLFISVHCNAHKDRRLHGVETFYLDLTDDRYSRRLAARENATSEKSISDLRYILADLALKSHVDDSIQLGEFIQKATVGKLRRHYKRIKDMKLKPALFYVLIGARMPSVLVESSFLSNPEEEKRLRSKTYRQRLANGIYTGIKNFIQQRNQALE